MAKSFAGRVASVDHARNAITLAPYKPLTHDEVHDFTLTKMREEFSKGASWADSFYWQLKTTFDPYNPVVCSEAPLFVNGNFSLSNSDLSNEELAAPSAVFYFPICWQACLIGRHQPFTKDLEEFRAEESFELRHIITQLAPQYVVSPQIVESVAIDGRPAPGRMQRS